MQLPFILQRRESPLTQRLVHSDGNGVGQVQAAHRSNHRQAQTAVGMAQQDVLVDAGILPAKNQVAVVRVALLGIDLSSLCGKKEERVIRMLFQKLLCILIIGDVQIVPVVQTGTLEFFVVDGKSHRSYQMQTRSGAGTGARNITGVLGNLRLKQHDIQPRLMWFQDIPSLKSSSEYDMKWYCSLYICNNCYIFTIIKHFPPVCQLK